MPAPSPNPIDWLSVALGAIAGLALFLYGVQLLATALKAAQGERFERLLRRSAATPVAGLASGTAATVALDSSSVTIILVIAIVDAGLLPFASALPVILGSNIGTTLSSQVFAWDAARWSPLLIAGGLLAGVILKGEKARAGAHAVMALGLVLFGLHQIGVAAEPLEGDPAVREWLTQLERPVLGVLAGAAATVALQSSSAMMGIVITLAGGGLITLPAGLAIMLGAEIGTCADTLLATLGRSREAVRAGLFHLLFNIATVAIGVLLLDQLTAFATASAGDIGQRIANAHVLFNVAGALLVLPFVGPVARGLTRLIPNRERAPAAPEPA